jgi:hypothetical protein
MTDRDDRMQRQTDEFDACAKLAEQYRRITMTPIVDDDYPSVRRDYEHALGLFIKALEANGRLSPPTQAIPTADNVVIFNPKERITKGPVPVKAVVDAARDAGLVDVVIMGFEADEEEYFASSMEDPSKVNWLCDRLKHILVTDSEPG